MYQDIVRLLKDKDAVVCVSGMIKANMADRRIEEIHAEKFGASEPFTDEDLEKFFGCAPNITGNQSTQQFIRKIRDAN